MCIRLVLTSLWVIVLWVPATAWAQTTAAQTGVEPGGTAKPGDKIFVTDRNGVQIGGRLLRRSPQALTLLVAGTEREILSSAVGRIEKRDSLWNGMLIGAVPFAVLGRVARRSRDAHGRPGPRRGGILGEILIGHTTCTPVLPL